MLQPAFFTLIKIANKKESKRERDYHGQNTSSNMANKNISSNETYSPTLIPKTIPKLQNSLWVRWYHGFSLKAYSELQNKERETRLKRAIKGIKSR